jgi:glucose/mannose-6-phosphate isomerase
MDHNLISSVDLKNYKQYLDSFPNYILDAYDLSKNINIKGKFDKIVVCGVGDNYVAGEILKFFFDDEPIPVFVKNDYDLFSFVNEKTLMFIVSYSGNDEVAVSCLKDALKKKCEVICITSGGRIQQICQTNTHKYILLPRKIPARASLPYLIISMLKVLENSKAIDDISGDVKMIASRLLSDQYHKKAQEIARNLSGKIPVIYTSNKFNFVAKRWKYQLNMNSKIHAFINTLPEMCENELEAYNNVNQMGPFRVLLLSSELDNPKIKRSYSLLKKILKDSGHDVAEISMVGSNPIQQIFSSIFFGDLISYYLAILYNVDPQSIDLIENLKNNLFN